MQLSKNFTLEEFTISQTAARRGINNFPSLDIIDTLIYTASQLELVRKNLSQPIIISSGYRCPELNKAVGGSKTSQHVEGKAVDFTSPRFGIPKQIITRILCSNIQFDQLILEYERWVHISFNKDNMRQQALVIDSTGTRIFA